MSSKKYLDARRIAGLYKVTLPRFASKDQVYAKLKDAGWRWSAPKQCWHKVRPVESPISAAPKTKPLKDNTIHFVITSRDFDTMAPLCQTWNHDYPTAQIGSLTETPQGWSVQITLQIGDFYPYQVENY